MGAPTLESERWKKASLAISSIIRGLELDQVEFQFDEEAWREVTSVPVMRALAASRSASAMPSLDVGSDLHPM